MQLQRAIESGLLLGLMDWFYEPIIANLRELKSPSGFGVGIVNLTDNEVSLPRSGGQFLTSALCAHRVKPFVLYRRMILDCLVPSARIVPSLDIIEDCHTRFLHGSETLSIQQLAF
jgi:hypothetical protein